jgi:hypothetical protein
MKITIIILLSIPFLSWSQNQKQGYDNDKYESAKVAFITNRLDLTSEQAEKFWPIFRKYNTERKSIMMEISGITKESSEPLSDPKAKELLEKRFVLHQKLLNREKEFYLEIGKVISIQQALQLSEINKEFARLLYRKNQGKIN